jgi:hypothetical protein
LSEEILFKSIETSDSSFLFIIPFTIKAIKPSAQAANIPQAQTAFFFID